MGKNKRLIAIFVVLSIFLLPSVYALEIGDTFGRVWEVFWRLMQDSYVVYGFTFILFMTLLYASCAAALSRVGV